VGDAGRPDAVQRGTTPKIRQVGEAIAAQHGFDDLSFVRWRGPPLTTIGQPLMHMGASAAERIRVLSLGRSLDHNRMELPTTLVVRDSTAAASRWSRRCGTVDPRGTRHIGLPAAGERSSRGPSLRAGSAQAGSRKNSERVVGRGGEQ
jgi:hypothetical protein